MRDFFSAAIGKLVRQVARLRGGGSALPGLVVERIDPGFLSRALGRLPHGVVAVSGTNGKTTTTKMIVEMLEARGLRVFTNRTGSNFSRGVVAAAIQECSLSGKLDADIAVLELDEAHAMYFIDRVRPRFTLLLNVLRDQLDRFGEIDTTAKLLQRIADATTEGLVVNREDRLIAAIGEQIAAKARARVAESSARLATLPAPERQGLIVAPGQISVREFGLSSALLSTFPSDDDFHSSAGSDLESATEMTGTAPLPGVAHSAQPAQPTQTERPDADVTLVEIGDHSAVFRIDGEDLHTELKLEGLYNTFNAAAALTTVRMVLAAPPLPGSPSRYRETSTNRDLIAALAEVRPAFGRGEQLQLDGQPLDLVLVKNPAGFRLGLASFEPRGVAVMIAINDQYADGRDMSWLWDVDFASLREEGVATVAGTRAWDMALRLEHDDVEFGAVHEDLGEALGAFRAVSEGRPRRIYCTYTAMLALRKELAELTDVEDIW